MYNKKEKLSIAVSGGIVDTENFIWLDKPEKVLNPNNTINFNDLTEEEKKLIENETKKSTTKLKIK